VRGQRAGLAASFEGWAISGNVRLTLPAAPSTGMAAHLAERPLLRGVIGDIGEGLGRAGAEAGPTARLIEEKKPAELTRQTIARDRGGVGRRSQFGPDPAAADYGWA
jgi:hypothetical protein